jgi:hypothetical protein
MPGLFSFRLAGRYRSRRPRSGIRGIAAAQTERPERPNSARKATHVAGRVGTRRRPAMNRTKTLTRAVILSVFAVGVLGTSAAMASFMGEGRHKGGYVKPCSLDGVNPAYHPDIFGNPALARAYYGFVRGRDGTWQVENNCHIYN